MDQLKTLCQQGENLIAGRPRKTGPFIDDQEEGGRFYELLKMKATMGVHNPGPFKPNVHSSRLILADPIAKKCRNI